MEETMIKKQRSLFLLVAFLAIHGQVAHGSLAALNAALGQSEAAVKSFCVQNPEFCARQAQRVRILAKYPSIFNVAVTGGGAAASSGGGGTAGGVIVKSTETVVDIIKQLDSILKIKDVTSFIDSFNAFTLSQVDPSLSVIDTINNTYIDRIKDSFPTTTFTITSLPNKLPQLSIGKKTATQTKQPTTTVVTEAEPNLIKYQKELLSLVKKFQEKTGGVNALNKDKTQSMLLTVKTFPATVISTLQALLETIIAIDPSMRILDPRIQPQIDVLNNEIKKIEDAFKANTKATQKDTDLMNRQRYALQKQIDQLSEASYQDSLELVNLKKLITSVETELNSLPKPPTEYDNLCNYYVPNFIADTTNYNALKKAFVNWRIKLMGATTNKDQRASLVLLGDNLKDFFRGIETYKAAYLPLSFLLDGSGKCKVAFHARNKVKFGDIATLKQAKLSAEDAYANALKSFQASYEAFLKANPLSSKDDLKAECKRLDEDYTKVDNSIEREFLLFKEALNKYVSPLDQEIQPLVNHLNGATTTTDTFVALLEEPTQPKPPRPGILVNPIVNGLYQSALQEYKQQQTDITSGKLTIEIDPSSGQKAVKIPATAPKGSALEQLNLVILKDKTIGIIQSARTFFEGFVKLYATSTTTQVFKNFMCAVLPPVANGWVPEETNITLVVDQDKTTGAFSVPPITYPTISPTPPNPFIVWQDIFVSRPLVMVEVEGKGAYDPSDPVNNEVKAKIGFLKKGYETETATISRDLGVWRTLLPTTVTDEPLPNGTDGYDLYLWTQTVAACSLADKTIENHCNLHRLYTAKVQTKKGDKSSGDFMIRLNDNCLPKTPVTPKVNTCLYKLYSFDSSKSSKNDEGVLVKHEAYGSIPKNNEMPYPDRLYNTMISKLKSLLDRTTPTAPAAAAGP